jgi:hypothetical protein
MLITRRSPLTGRTSTLDLPVTIEQLQAWHAGVLLQRAFPNLSADEREFIKTGLLPHEWDLYLAHPFDGAPDGTGCYICGNDRDHRTHDLEAAARYKEGHS